MKGNTETGKKKSVRAVKTVAVKPTKRQLQAMETKNKIYKAAIEEINKKGFNNVNIEDITTAANVAKGSFYTHFESKEALVFYTFERSDKLYKEAYQKIQDRNFLDTLPCFVGCCYEEYEKRGKGIIRAIISNYFNTDENLFYNKDRELYKCLYQIVEHGKQEGVLDKETDSDSYVKILLSTMIGIEVLWCFDDRDRRNDGQCHPHYRQGHGVRRKRQIIPEKWNSLPIRNTIRIGRLFFWCFLREMCNQTKRIC